MPETSRKRASMDLIDEISCAQLRVLGCHRHDCKTRKLLPRSFLGNTRFSTNFAPRTLHNFLDTRNFIKTVSFALFSAAMVSDDAQFTASLRQLRNLTQGLAEHLVQLTHAAPATTEGDAACDSELRRSYSQIDSQLGGFHSQLSNIKAQLDSTTFSVAVLALAKSGKSTLLNALIGRDLLPSNNVPETARIVRIHHVHDTDGEGPILRETRTSTRSPPELQRTVSIDAIRSRLEQLNHEHRATPWSRTDDLDLEIATSIVGLQQACVVDHNAAPAVRLELIDTPGPNEAGEERLKQQVVRLLGSSADAVLYVLDYTKLKTTEEVCT